jgi:hypothetical protein
LGTGKIVLLFVKTKFKNERLFYLYKKGSFIKRKDSFENRKDSFMNRKNSFKNRKDR